MVTRFLNNKTLNTRGIPSKEVQNSSVEKIQKFRGKQVTEKIQGPEEEKKISQLQVLKSQEY